MRPTHPLTAFLAVALLAACSDEATEPEILQLGKILGDAQTAQAGAALPTAPSVRVTRTSGAPAAGLPVTFAVASGGGSITGATQISGPDGIATVGSWTLGQSAGTNTLTVTSTDARMNGDSVTFTATGTAGPAAVLAKAAGDGQRAAVGTALSTSPTVRLTDQFGNAVAGATVSFTVETGGGVVAGGTQTTGADGTARPTSWALGRVPGTNTLTATATDTPVSGSPATFTAIGDAGPPASIVKVEGDEQTTSPGTSVAVRPLVRVLDAFGNRVPGAPVAFTVTEGGGTVTGATPTTTVDGEAGVGGWTLGTTAGPQALSATVSSNGFPGGSVVFTAAAVATTQATITEVAVVAGEIWDMDGRRILYTGDDRRRVLRVRHIQGGLDEVVQADSQHVVTEARLTDTGALFVDRPEFFSPSSRLREWRDGTVTTLQTRFEEPPGAWWDGVPRWWIDVEGRHAAFVADGILYRRDLVTGTTVTIPRRSAGGYPNIGRIALGPDGDIVWLEWDAAISQNTPKGDVFRYRDGAVIQLSSRSEAYRSHEPQTDGTNIVYAYEWQSPYYYEGGNGGAQIFLYTDRETELTVRSPQELSGARAFFPSFAVAGGWVAFNRPDNGGVWVRSPEGRMRQLATGRSGVWALDANGTVVYGSGGLWVSRANFYSRAKVPDVWGESCEFCGPAYLRDVRFAAGKLWLITSRSVWEVSY